MSETVQPYISRSCYISDYHSCMEWLWQYSSHLPFVGI